MVKRCAYCAADVTMGYSTIATPCDHAKPHFYDDPAERVGVVGSRRFIDRDAVYEYVFRLERGTIVVSGGAEGPDTWAEEAAKERDDLPAPVIFKAPWDVVEHNACHTGCEPKPTSRTPSGYYWPHAGFNRNGLIVAASDRVAAFIVDEKGGTWDTVTKARAAKKPVELHRPRVKIV